MTKFLNIAGKTVNHILTAVKITLEKKGGFKGIFFDVLFIDKFLIDVVLIFFEPLMPINILKERL